MIWKWYDDVRWHLCAYIIEGMTIILFIFIFTLVEVQWASQSLSNPC
jgi:hypothetical protein